MADVEKYIGESAMKDRPEKKLNLRIKEGAIVTDLLGKGSVTNSKIADDAVTTDKLSGVDDPGGAAVTTSKIVDNAVTESKIAKDAVTSDKIQKDAINSDHIKESAVESRNIGDGQVLSRHIQDNAVTSDKLSDADSEEGAAVTAGKIAAGAVHTEHIAANAVVAGNIASGAVQEGSIAAGAVTAGKIAANAVTTEKLSGYIDDQGVTHDAAVTNAKIANNAVTTAKIGDGEVHENHLAPGAITTEKLATPVIEQLQTIMDAVPTAGSVKPVNSNGVYKFGIAKEGKDVSSYLGAWNNNDYASYATFDLDASGHNGTWTLLKSSGAAQRIRLDCNNLINGEIYRIRFNFVTSNGLPLSSIGFGETTSSNTWKDLIDIYGNRIYAENGIIDFTFVKTFRYLLIAYNGGNLTFPMTATVSDFSCERYYVLNEIDKEIDDKPTKGSNKFVRSGGVAEAIEDSVSYANQLYKTELEKNVARNNVNTVSAWANKLGMDNNITYYDNTLVDTDVDSEGTVVSGTSRVAIKKISKGDIYTVVGHSNSGSGNFSNIALWYSANKPAMGSTGLTKQLLKLIDGGITDTVIEWTALADGWLAVRYFPRSTNYYLLYKKEEFSKDIGLYMPEKISLPYTNGKAIDADENSESFGQEITTTSTYFGVTDFIDIEGAKYLSIIQIYNSSSIFSGNVYGSVFYDAEYNAITVANIYVHSGNNFSGRTYCAVPANAKYIRCTTYENQSIFVFRMFADEYIDKEVTRYGESEIENIPSYTYAINTTGKYGTSAGYKHLAINVKEGEQFYYTQSASAAFSRFALAKTHVVTKGGDIDLVDGTSVVEYPQGTNHSGIITIPPTCKYLLLFNVSNVFTYGVISEIKLDVEELKKDGSLSSKYAALIRQASYIHESTPPTKALGLLHLSDIHTDGTADKNIFLRSEEFAESIDDVICTGDVVLTYLSSGDGTSWWRGTDLVNKALFVLGNHDQCYSSDSNKRYSYFWADAGENGDGNIDTTIAKSEAIKSTHIFSYNKYFADYLAEWGVTMPIGYDDPTSPYYQACYWHKDYAAQKIRIIGIDCVYRFDGILAKDGNGDFIVDSETGMLAIADGGEGLAKLTTEQETWFKNLLDETLDSNNDAYGYSVVVCCHYPLEDIKGLTTLNGKVNEGYGIVQDHKTSDTVNFNHTTGAWDFPLEKGFNMRNRVASESASYGYNKGSVNNFGDILHKWHTAATAAFEEEKFVAWICGHLHTDVFYYSEMYPDLLIVSIDQAGYKRPTSYADRDSSEESRSCANYYAIDSVNHYLKIVRLGLTMDKRMRPKNYMCYNYSERITVSEG